MCFDGTRAKGCCKQVGILSTMPPVTRTTEPPRRGGRGARQRILKAAAELFYCEGINATGVELIANKASVSKRTLYQHFPSKSALVEEYLRGLRQAAGEADKMPTWTSWLPVGMFVLPMMIAPARRNRATASASWVGT